MTASRIRVRLIVEVGGADEHSTSGCASSITSEGCSSRSACYSTLCTHRTQHLSFGGNALQLPPSAKSTAQLALVPTTGVDVQNHDLAVLGNALVSIVAAFHGSPDVSTSVSNSFRVGTRQPFENPPRFRPSQYCVTETELSVRVLGEVAPRCQLSRVLRSTTVSSAVWY